AGSCRSSASSRSRSVPHRARGLEDHLELAPLDVLAYRCRSHAAEAALRAERKLLERQIAARLVDPAAQQILRLDLRALGGDEAEHRDLALGDVAQRLEAAGAVAVVFEQQAVVIETAEQALGDRIIVALAVPLRCDLAGRRIDGAGAAAA